MRAVACQLGLQAFDICRLGCPAAAFSDLQLTPARFVWYIPCVCQTYGTERVGPTDADVGLWIFTYNFCLSSTRARRFAELAPLWKEGNGGRLGLCDICWLSIFFNSVSLRRVRYLCWYTEVYWDITNEINTTIY